MIDAVARAASFGGVSRDPGRISGPGCDVVLYCGGVGWSGCSSVRGATAWLWAAADSVSKGFGVRRAFLDRAMVRPVEEAAAGSGRAVVDEAEPAVDVGQCGDRRQVGRVGSRGVWGCDGGEVGVRPTLKGRGLSASLASRRCRRPVCSPGCRVPVRVCAIRVRGGGGVPRARRAPHRRTA